MVESTTTATSTDILVEVTIQQTFNCAEGNLG